MLREMLDLQPAHLAAVLNILAKHAPTCDAWAFGSRVNGTAQRFSDLDICLSSAQPLDFEEKANLRLAFSESDLPWVVDVVDLSGCSKAFALQIEADRVSLAFAA